MISGQKLDPKSVTNSCVTMKNLNEHIANVMRNVFLPESGERFDFGEISELCCMPQFKFLLGASNPTL